MGLVFLLAGWPQEAAGAEFRILPAITVGEEYNDNVFLTPNNKQDDLITLISPAFVLGYKTGFWSWDMDFAYDYRTYLKRTRTEDTTYRLDLRNRTVLIDNLLFFEARDLQERVSLDVTKDYTLQSTFVNQTDQNILTLNPYVVAGPGSGNKMFLGYKYVNSRYTDPSAVNTVDNTGYIETLSTLSSNVTFSTGILYTRSAGSRFTRDIPPPVKDYYRTDLYAGPRYAYSQNSYVYCLLGGTWVDFTGVPQTKHLLWDLGFSHRYSTMTLTAVTKTEMIPDPVRILRRLDSFVVSLAKESPPRTSLRGSVGWYEYRNAATNHLENIEYRLTGAMRYELTPTLTISGELDSSRLFDYTMGVRTYVGEAGISLDRRILKGFTVALGYQYLNSYSPDSYEQNYVVNRISVNLTYRF
jgi:uncharacterized protein (PEP-CTERM system associated)